MCRTKMKCCKDSYKECQNMQRRYNFSNKWY